MPPIQSRTAPVIAVVGSDGSGKSTVCEHLLAWIGRYGEARYAHLGKQSGNVGRAISRWPLVGRFMGRTIERKAKSVDKHFHEDTQPGLLPALVISLFTIRRKRRFKRMLKLHRAGFIVVTDRFPQTVVVGAYDGPGLPKDAPGNWLVRRLARREHAAFAWMARFKPDLVLRLNVDVAVAAARKPDHNPAKLARKIAVTPKLSFNGAPIADIDTNVALPEVLKQVESAVARRMDELGWSPRNPVA